MLLIRIVLAAIFIASGVMKIADRSAVRGAASELGVPPSLAGPVTALLVGAELVIAFFLLVRVTAPEGGWSAFVVLTGLSGVVTVNLARRRAVVPLLRPVLHRCDRMAHGWPQPPARCGRSGGGTRWSR